MLCFLKYGCVLITALIEVLPLHILAVGLLCINASAVSSIPMILDTILQCRSHLPESYFIQSKLKPLHNTGSCRTPAIGCHSSVCLLVSPSLIELRTQPVFSVAQCPPVVSPDCVLSHLRHVVTHNSRTGTQRRLLCKTFSVFPHTAPSPLPV